ncbi:MAG: phosphoribosylformylglycinamidine synthase subunit PurL [Alphaproteobacteria bacterium]
MAYRIEVLAPGDDGRALKIEKALESKGKKASVRIADVYTLEKQPPRSFIESVSNPVTQIVNSKLEGFDWALEIGFLPGVTDNVGHTADELLRLAADNDNHCYSSRLYLIKGKVTQADIEALAGSLANRLIQRIQIKDAREFKKDGGMDAVIPKVVLDHKGTVADEVDLNVADSELSAIGKDGIKNADGTRRGPLGMSLLYMKAVQDYFKSEGRKAKDIEIETIAQTWSEHCKHKIFASPIDDVKDGLYRHYIKRATNEIRAKRGKDDICVSVFSDNAGAIIFDENYLITDKVETHNSPSALDPFGGAITGIVGVNRDCMGFGQGAKPVVNRYGFCLADPRTNPEYYRDNNRTDRMLSPETIMNGVVRGVESGGNCSGIPTPQGFLYFDPRFVGKPLVFVGTIGLIPREVNSKPSHEKKARPGDKIVMTGGRVGRDGIHGATFSSVALDEGSPATAVQIGDPITQKKMSDAIVKEVRDFGWYSAITDNGAGGLSSSVGEMAGQSGGFYVELDKVPLKYPGMAPWEIWISESQERMTMAVPLENTEKLIKFLAKRGVEATVVGTYTDTGRAQISWQGETIMDMSMDFLHDGLPETPLKTTFTPGGEDEPALPEPKDHGQMLETMLGRLNICSREFISTQYDHNVQGSAVMGPLQGPGRVYAEATVTKPALASVRGVVLSQGLAPRYSDIDTGHMASYAVDMAVRNAVAAGVDFKHLALLDNFCWCSSDEPERLGQLKRAVEAIYNLAVLYETPFISGKDSMFNDFKGFDASGAPVKISAPPTLLVSSIGVIPHVEQSISLAPKAVGDLVYLLGETKNELGGSEYYDQMSTLGRNVPVTDGPANLYLYNIYTRAARERLIASAYAVGHGGLGVALAKKAIAGQMGLDIRFPERALRADTMLYSESAGRIVVTVAPQNKKAFEKMFGKYHHLHEIGHVAFTDRLSIKNVLDVKTSKLEEAYKAPLRNY